MTRENVVQLIGVVVAVLTVAVLIMALAHLF
jgi:hypothetical protein